MLSSSEQDERHRNLRDSIHSVEMEGGQVDPETQQQMAAYARGEMTAAELDQWVLAHARQIADASKPREG